MKTFIFIVLLFCAYAGVKAQNDTIYIKGNQVIICNDLQEIDEQYMFVFLTSDNRKAKSSILKWLVDSVKYAPLKVDTTNLPATKKNSDLNEQVINKDTLIVDSNHVDLYGKSPPFLNPLSHADTTSNAGRPIMKTDSVNIVSPPVNPTDTTKVSPWLKSVGIGFNLGYLLERNNPVAPNTDLITLNSALHLGLNYFKDSCKFAMTNELHYISSVQNENITGGVRLKRVQDDITSLHDISYDISKNNKLRLNLILRSATSIFTIYNGDYYKDYNNLGPTQGFGSPYDIVISPGLKYQPNEFLRISFSIYSVQLYGISNDAIAQNGVFITDQDANCKFKNFVFRHLGAEFNFWYDGQVKEWLFVQYRLSISTDFFENFGGNGLVDGLFITKIQIFKDFYLSHQATIKSNFAVDFYRPFFNQMLLFTYEKTF